MVWKIWNDALPCPLVPFVKVRTVIEDFNWVAIRVYGHATSGPIEVDDTARPKENTKAIPDVTSPKQNTKVSPDTSPPPSSPASPQYKAESRPVRQDAPREYPDSSAIKRQRQDPGPKQVHGATYQAAWDLSYSSFFIWYPWNTF